MSTDIHMVKNDQSSQNQPESKKKGAHWFENLRGSLMTVAVLVASATYTAGLSPPGGLWQDNLNGHTAGAPILLDTFPRRYITFFYANATAFMSSLVIIILLTNENVYESKSKNVVLLISMVADLVSMMIAYAAGCARSFHTSIYVIALAVVALFFVFCWSRLLLPLMSYVLSKKMIKRLFGEATGRGLVAPSSDSAESDTNGDGGTDSAV